MDVMNVLMWIVFGLIAGALAKFLMPGKDPGGIVVTILLGIAGALVGGFIGNAFGFGWAQDAGARGQLLDWRNLVLAIGGAFLILLAYRAFRMLFGALDSASTPYSALYTHAGHEAPTGPNLTEVARNALTSDAVHKLSSAIGENTSKTKKALEAMIPAILAGAASQASTSSGAAQLFDMAKHSVEGGTDLVSNLASHLSGTGIENMGRAGPGILSALFGDKISSLLSWFGRYAGISNSSATSLMSVAASLVMNLLGKQILQHGLSASSLGSLLDGQKGWLARLLPSGVSEIPGLQAFADYAGQAGAAVRETAQAGERAVRGAAHEAYRTGVGAVQNARPLASALVPLLLVALALFALPWLMRAWTTKDTPVAKGPEVKVPEDKGPGVQIPAGKDAAIQVSRSGYGPDLGKLASFKLPNGVNVEIPENSFLHSVYKFLSGPVDTKSRSFVFEKLDFDGASVKTAPETETAVNTLSVLVKAFPSVQLRIEGHTDKGSDADADRRVSLERANAVKDLLVKASIPADRISTEGFGSDKPIAPNDSDENRAKNRRIEFTLMRK
jgi:outer membrane protein OmpA-like peptidoglycan-associated protein/uncharacterized membrane protein YeaQ/YmgE (transglycosylase-associated protein family)